MGANRQCEACGAGGLISFDWAYAREHAEIGIERNIDAFVEWMPLRRGSLYRCKVCNEPWHLDDSAQLMTYVLPERLPLILRWNEAAITLPSEIAASLDAIRPTPPDLYGNGRGQRVTPCSVETTTGETIEIAAICVQRGAPVEHWFDYRLASEVKRVSPSKFALAYRVREASSRAEEMRMGFSPSLIEMPDGRRFVMNGRTDFMQHEAYNAADARPITGDYFNETPSPDFVSTNKNPAYFVADGDPEWVEREIPTRRQASGKPTGLFRRLFG